jgi:hypothetical protein
MKTIIIIIGLTAAQLQERSNIDLGLADLYDMDARYLRGPISVRYQVKDVTIDLPESELVSLSFDMGILTSANITPHRRPLDGPETAQLCLQLEKNFISKGFVFAYRPAADNFKHLIEVLKQGQEPESVPPWTFGWKLGKNTYVSVAIRRFESASLRPHDSDVKRYTIDLGFSDSTISDAVEKQMSAVRAKYFPNRQRVPMSEYPKEFSHPQ